MKDLRDLSFSRKQSSSDIAESYNRMRSKTPSTLFEAKRTMEALVRVQGNELLLEKVKEEVENAGT